MPTLLAKNADVLVTMDGKRRELKNAGIRFHASRGSMSRGESKGGPQPDDCVEDEDFIMQDSERVISKYHDACVGSMTQIVLAPCSPFSVTETLLKDAAALARRHKV